MKDYEELYYEYRSKYYNACEQINACERMIASLQERRRATVNRINELNTSSKKLKDAIGDLKKVLDREDNVSEKLTKVSQKMETASENFSSMVKASDVNNKSLTDVFSSEASSTKSAISNIFSTVKTRKANLEKRLEEQEKDLKQAKEELKDIDSSIRREKEERGDWQRTKNNNYNNMEYYKRKMEQEAY